MPQFDDFDIPPEQERLDEILVKIVGYQHSLPGGRAVEMDELLREEVLSPADAAFLKSHSVTYKPHRLDDYHAGDMLHMPTKGGGCVFVGPCGPPLKKRSVQLLAFQGIVENFLRLPRPRDELLLHIEFSEHDGMAVSPQMISFGLRRPRWRERLPAIRAVAAEFGLEPFQDEIVQGSHTLTYSVSAEASKTAGATVALLSRGCGITDGTRVTYSAGALDEM